MANQSDRRSIDQKRQEHYENLRLGKTKLAPEPLDPRIIARSEQPFNPRHPTHKAPQEAIFNADGGMRRPATEADDSNAYRHGGGLKAGVVSKGALVEGDPNSTIVVDDDTGDVRGPNGGEKKGNQSGVPNDDPLKPDPLHTVMADIIDIGDAPPIPGYYKDKVRFPWNEARALARQFRDGPVTNLADAISVLDKEVKRRRKLKHPETGELLNPDPEKVPTSQNLPDEADPHQTGTQEQGDQNQDSGADLSKQS